MQFIDLKSQQDRIRQDIDRAIARVLDHGKYVLGPEVKELEQQLQKFCGAKHAIACANGTDALTTALMALGVGAGDIVIVPSFTFIASAGAIAQLGAIPFFVDVCQDSFNIDAQSIKQAIQDLKTSSSVLKAIVIVDLFGQPADFDAINQIAKNENVPIIVDAAQSFGASYKGKKTGSFGGIITTSFFPAKPLGCYGDGGAILTNDDTTAQIIRSIHQHGDGSKRYHNERIGFNSRLDSIQAAILLEKLKIFTSEIVLRQQAADNYHEVLSGFFVTPTVQNNCRSIWAQYTVKSDDRQQWLEKFQQHKIPTAVYYPIPLHQQQGYKNFPTVSDGLGVTEQLSKQVFSLPMHSYLEEDHFEKVQQTLVTKK